MAVATAMTTRESCRAALRPYLDSRTKRPGSRAMGWRVGGSTGLVGWRSDGDGARIMRP